MTPSPHVPEEFWSLADALINGTIDAAGLARLEAALAADPQLQDFFVEYWELHADIHVAEAASAVSGRALAPGAPTLARSASEGASASTLARSASEGASPVQSASQQSTPHAPREDAHHAERDGYYGRRYVSYAAAAVVLLATGILAYTLWPKQPAQPVAVKPVVDPAATLASATDAQWLGPFRPQDNAISPGQRLVLERGLAEITFSRQARVIVQSPADIVIVDGGACRLASGKLTAYVPAPAKGFQVHTPDGTVTDLGTEFGVYVKTGHEVQDSDVEVEQQPEGGPQPGQQPPVTEVHVFQGKVDITGGDSLALRSEIPNPKSQIVSAGQAVTISEHKVQPLPAADPFQFSLDKLQGKPRQVLLAEDFETYPVGDRVQAIGPWTVQSGTRKGQGIHVYDPRAKLAQMAADAANPVDNLSPAPAIGSRVAFIAASALNPRDTFPVLAREIDGKLLTKNCQVLVEFDYMPLGEIPQFSVALATEPGHAPGIELWRDVDAAKNAACPGYQWYRLRVLLDVADGVVREARAERWHWLSSQGWVRDLTFQPPTPKLDWTTPPRYAMFGFPVVSQDTPAGNFWLDNVRIEVISE